MKDFKSRHSKKYLLWQESVFHRDNHCCVKCEETDGLCAHHIIGWDKDKNLRYEINNGLTLCRACHVKIHFEMDSFGMTGKKHSPEAKNKMRLARIGKSPSNKGIPKSAEAKQKMRLAKLGKKRGPMPEETKNKLSAAHTGKKRQSPSSEVRKKMSDAQKSRMQFVSSIYKGMSWVNCLETGKRIWIGLTKN